MAVKIRLQRHGKKGKPFFHIVSADVRAKRDGKFIEKLGTYNPNTNPATILLDVDRALYWLQNGAEPTDTARAILSYKGVLYRNHLAKGVAKGAFTQETADARFEQWIAEKANQVQAKKDGLSTASQKEASERMAREKEVSDKRAAEIAAANAPVAEEVVVEEEATAVEEAPVAEEATAVEEAPVAEEVPAVEEAPVAEEAPAVEEATVAEEAPAVEDAPVAEEAPAAEEGSEEEKEA
ncbi:MAG: 30S ribosomal protein S16 [Cryomorphaceae bacterium]|nr:30S ribosomal protein S16 [Cryomorphaceae bacterium]